MPVHPKPPPTGDETKTTSTKSGKKTKKSKKK
jgi:hypothetical protein